MTKRKPAAKQSAPPATRDIDLLYREEILDHYRRPHHFGSLPDANLKRRETNFSCGDDLEFQIKTENHRVRGIAFTGRGCAVSVAAASMLTDKVIGMNEKQIAKLTAKDIMRLLGVEFGPARIKCALLGLRAVQQAITPAPKGESEKK
ncbi:MAG: iron-sulfur cluster assembly scaffold protein [Patescibacteria group bacterium]|nr:iron-sulfur cluster assembly scaffold protein [Patescibacteria group bacterium]